MSLPTNFFIGRGGGSSALYEFTSHTFNHAGGNGRTPASDSSFTSGLSSYSWYTGGGSAYYSVSSGIQQLIVPETATYLIRVEGAKGGFSGSNRGGYGAQIQGQVSLTAGDILEFVCGHNPLASSRGSNGISGSGGGASYVAIQGQANPLIVAGGGGGAAGPWPGYAYSNAFGSDASLTEVATPPQAPSGSLPPPQTGGVGGINEAPGAGPGGGWTSAGSSQGVSNGATPGEILNGNAYGGSGGDGAPDGGFGSGGGGRNVIGGGGGGWQGGSCAGDKSNSAGGGGGASYVAASISSVAKALSSNADGSIYIEKL